ncbi:MAG: hypothetical protein JXA15_13585 [Spirochaetales bacterium]|nr:hypothetical protein [Spirochaetales bacterium]
MQKRRIRFAILIAALAALVAAPLGAQTTAPFALGDLFSQAPEVTVGFEGEYGSAVSSNRALGWDSAYDRIVYDPMVKAGTAFAAAPWIGLQWGGLQMTTRFSYDQDQLAGTLPMLGGTNLIWADDYVIESTFSIDLGLLQLTERILFDPYTPDYYEDFGAVFESGKISAGFRTFAQYDDTNPFLFFTGSFNDHQIADAWMAADDLGGLVDLRIGGVDARYLRLQSLFFDEDPTAAFSELIPLITKPVFASQDRTRGLLQVRSILTPYVMSGTRTAVSASAEFGALNVYNAMSIPFGGATTFEDWLRTRNVLFGARYAVDGLGTFDAGWELGLGYKRDFVVITATEYKDYRYLGDNRFWLDADLDLVEGLELLAGFDLRLFGFQDLDKATGVGTPVDPVVLSYDTAFAANVGVEAKYGLDSLLDGLAVEGGLYLAINGGKTFDQVDSAVAETFDQYLDATYPTANYVRLGSLTEQAWLNENGEYDGNAPLVAYLAGLWQLDEAWGLKLANQFLLNSEFLDGGVTYYTSAVTPPIGFYSVDAVELGVSYTEGKAVFTLGFAWEFPIGIPSAADLGYTDGMGTYATAKDIYKDEGPYGTTGRSPWTLAAGVTLEF